MLDRRNGRPETGIIRDGLAIQRHIEVHAHEDTFVRQIQIRNRQLIHGLTLTFDL